MASKEIEICNRALWLVQSENITSFDEGTVLSGICASLWPEIRDEVIQDYPWNCAIRRKFLSPLSSAPEWGFQYQFQLPDSCLRVWQFEEGEPWRCEGRQLLSDASFARITYISRISASEMDARLRRVIAAKMAAELAPVLTDNQSLGEDLYRRFEIEYARARSADAQEGTAGSIEHSGWIESRMI